MEPNARMHVTVRQDEVMLDGFSSLGHMFTIVISERDLIDAIVGIERKLDCQIVHPPLDNVGKKEYNRCDEQMSAVLSGQ